MQKILRKRVWRSLKSNAFRYLALGALIVLGMYLIVSLVGAADTVIAGVNEKAEENCLEDGEFQLFLPLTDVEIKEFTDRGIQLEQMFCLDFKLEDESVVRVFRNREQINRIDLDKGRLAEGEGEAVLEKRYCEEHGITAGDEVVIGGSSFQVVGIGSVPDYDAPYRNLTDSNADSRQFGLAFVNGGSYDALKESGDCIKSEEYQYAYRLNGVMPGEEFKKELQEMKIQTAELSNGMEEWKNRSDEFLDEYFDTNLSRLIQFLNVEDNPRIKASADDQIINKTAGLIAGVIVMVLFTYVISVFVIHGIDRERDVIGALYALGVTKKELTAHYMTLPVAVTFLAGIIGTALGYSKLGIPVQIRDCYEYFSVPFLHTVYSPWILFYGIAMPPLVAAAVNGMVIRRRLSRPVLELIRNEPKKSRIWNKDLKNMGFIGRFRIRQMLREARTGLTVLFSMFISMLILMIGIDCYVMCMHISEDNKADTKYEYMYTFKYPEGQVPEGGEACYAERLKKEIYGYDLEVTLLGIGRNNPYFDVKDIEGKNQAAVSSAMAQKYRLSVGDKLILTDGEEEMDYTFTVREITQYSTGLYAFMDIDSMRELFGQGKDYYNVVLAGHSLDIDPSRLYGITTKEEISKSSDIFVSMMMPMISLMTAVSALIFCVVMYLMMKVMVDRSSFSISLFKIFGYRTKEIRKLYLDGNFYMIAVGAAVCLPLSKKLMDAMYPALISNVACGMDLTFSWKLYLGIYAAVICLYLVISQLLVRKVKRVTPAEVLKVRE